MKDTMLTCIYKSIAREGDMNNALWQRVGMVAALLLLLLVLTFHAPATGQSGGVTPYKAKDFSYILGMTGISDKTLLNHFKLYQGYVSNTNMLLARTDQLLSEGKADIAGIRRGAATVGV